MNPNGVHDADFYGASPLLEGCDPRECTDRVGGEHAPTCEPETLPVTCDRTDHDHDSLLSARTCWAVA